MTAAAIVGGIGAIGSLVGANQQAKATDRASRAQVKASQRGQELLSPFIDGSSDAFREQQALSGALGPEAENEALRRITSSENFRFLQEQGAKDVNASASTRGLRGSGTRLKALQDRSANILRSQVNERFNRFGDITRTGLSAAGGQSNLIGQEGEARAARDLGRAQALTSGLQGFTQGLGTVIGGFRPETNVKGV